jgi:hypothetical protein
MDIEEFIQTTLTQIIDGVKKHKTLPGITGGT